MRRVPNFLLPSTLGAARPMADDGDSWAWLGRPASARVCTPPAACFTKPRPHYSRLPSTASWTWAWGTGGVAVASLPALHCTAQDGAERAASRPVIGRGGTDTRYYQHIKASQRVRLAAVDHMTAGVTSRHLAIFLFLLWAPPGVAVWVDYRVLGTTSSTCHLSLWSSVTKSYIDSCRHAAHAALPAGRDPAVPGRRESRFQTHTESPRRDKARQTKPLMEPLA